MTHLFEQLEGRKTAGAASRVRTREGRGVAARRVGKPGRKSEGRPPSPLSSISDKNKVNGEWCCRRGGCCSAEEISGGDGTRVVATGTGGGENDASLRPGRIKVKGEKQKVRRSMLPAT